MPSADERWTAVDRYLTELLVSPDPALAAALDSDLPPHDVSPLEGKLLYLLARAVEARAVLELGTLAGYSTIWLLAAEPRVSATAIQTVGAKGYDGLALALVL